MKIFRDRDDVNLGTVACTCTGDGTVRFTMKVPRDVYLHKGDEFIFEGDFHFLPMADMEHDSTSS